MAAGRRHSIFQQNVEGLTMKSKLNRRTFIGVMSLGVSAPALLRASGRPVVKVIGYAGLFEDNYKSAVVEIFKQQHSDIDVVYRAVRNSTEAAALIRAQAGNPEFDVVILDSSISAQLARENLFAEVDAGKVSNLKSLPEWAQPRGGHGPAVTQDALVVTYAPKRIAKPVNSWMDLADPAFAGRLGLAISDLRGAIMLTLLSSIAGEDYKTSVDGAIDTLKTFAKNAQTFDPQPDVYTAVRSGLVDLGVGWNARSQTHREQAGDEFDARIPAEGTVSQINTINLVTNAPSGQTAQTFIDYAIGPDAQAAFAKAMFYGPTNESVTLEPELRARIFGDEATHRRQVTIDWEWIGQNSTALLQRIRREVMAS
jgi:putative spermidine/putrescine transport system substrate-binding protein